MRLADGSRHRCGLGGERRRPARGRRGRDGRESSCPCARASGMSSTSRRRSISVRLPSRSIRRASTSARKGRHTSPASLLAMGNPTPTPWTWCRIARRSNRSCGRCSPTACPSFDRVRLLDSVGRALRGQHPRPQRHRRPASGAHEPRCSPTASPATGCSRPPPSAAAWPSGSSPEHYETLDLRRSATSGSSADEPILELNVV